MNGHYWVVITITTQSLKLFNYNFKPLQIRLTMFVQCTTCIKIYLHRFQILFFWKTHLVLVVNKFGNKSFDRQRKLCQKGISFFLVYLNVF